jgi:5-carboxymethyl-2-hydroxymuconate isomerase
MPHLQFEVNKRLNINLKKEFVDFIEIKFSEIMQTGTDHIAISIREMNKENLSLGRVDKEETVCLMNLDIRIGRSDLQKKDLVRNFIIGVEKILGIKAQNQYVTITSHVGEEFNFFEKNLSDWRKNDDPANTR